jgi:hypothetical protein
MESVYAREVGIFVVLALVEAWLIKLFASVCYSAIKAGIYPARGRVYLRDMHPVRFWLAVLFYPGLALLFATLMLLKIYVWFRR